MATEASSLFVSFEGIDGSGKSTQARFLAERLRALGREVVLTREPGGSPGAEEIRRLVLTGDRARWSPETEILLFTAARRDHLEKTIRPALARGAVVITDRFADSTRLYQGATRGDLRGVVDRLHDLMIGLEPDLTVIIDMDPAKALARSVARLRVEKTNHDGGAVSGASTTIGLAEDRFESFGLAFQERIRLGFLDLARAASHRIVVIDGDRPESEVSADVASLALARLVFA